ncbi:MAG: gliding motility-associated C-terminal domain-containing protein [Bacteroidales bacterium]
MAKRVLIFMFMLALALPSAATHNRAGEITYKQLSALSFEFTITTFTYSLSLADRPRLEVNWGDNSTSIAERVEKVLLPNFYFRNTYKINHTFPGPGVYRVVVQDPNRNLGIVNIPNSVNVVFSIQTILTVNPSIGLNQTPILLNPPYDKAAKGKLFIHNPAAFDPDGDSLSYQLTVCTREDGKPIENYTYPPATNVFYVDSITGDLVWDTPADTGAYNVAIEIQEWRDGRKISVVVRDMQIDVYDTDNEPPVNDPLRDWCVEVGDTVDFYFISNDPDEDMVQQSSTSGVFNLGTCNAIFTRLDSIPGRSISRFFWVPCHETVRQQPYDVIFKSEDIETDVQLVDIDNMKIKVLGPPPVLQSAVPEGKVMRLSWEPYGTDFIAGFAIYRREGVSSFEPDSCVNGLPEWSGFSRVGFATGAATTTYTDSNNGEGLDFGVEYAYRIVAVYPNGTESKASNELVSSLVTGVPVIRNVSVRTTDITNGSIELIWKKPDGLDTIPTVTGPYEYLIYRADGVSGEGFQLIASIPSADLNDTVYIDNLINTTIRGYIYKVELYNDAPGNRFLIGDPGIASSIFIQASPGDRKVRFTISRNVPWINTRYDFFRYNEVTLTYDSIGSTNQLEWVDTGLENGENYCYYVRSYGGYVIDGYPKDLLNFSQTTCAVPVDNEPPCPPEIWVSSECDSLYNLVRWAIDDRECFDDVAGYRIHYKPEYEGDLNEIMEINDPNVFSYKHYPGILVAGCYGVTAYDSVGNESDMSLVICVDSCDFYEIPNVFTPNGDGINDLLVARASSMVERVDFKLYNRVGQMIFSTEEPKLNWDGTYRGKIVSPGIYFYHCDVYEMRITGLELFHLSGFVHVITEKGAVLTPPIYKK